MTRWGRVWEGGFLKILVFLATQVRVLNFLGKSDEREGEEGCCALFSFGRAVQRYNGIRVNWINGRWRDVMEKGFFVSLYEITKTCVSFAVVRRRCLDP